MASIEIIKSLTPQETLRLGEDFGSISLQFGDEIPGDDTYIDAADIKILSEDPALSQYLSYEIDGSTVQFRNLQPIDLDNPDTPKSFTFTAVFDIDKFTVRDGVPAVADYKVITKTYTIKIADLNDEAPRDFQLLGSSVSETAVGGRQIGRFAAHDPDRGDALTYTLLDDSSGNFEIVGNRLVLKAGVTLDHEAQATCDVTVKVEDRGLHSVTKSFKIDVLNAAERPTDIALEGGSVSELATEGTVIGTLSGLDPDDDPSRLIFEIGKNKTFAIDGDKIVLLATAKLDFETRPEVRIAIEARDPDGRRYTEDFIIRVENGIEHEGTKDADYLNGNNTAEDIWALDGNDKIFAGGGDDRIWAGEGVDRATGGTGDDYFIFKSAVECGDIIADFERGEDKIAFSAKFADSFDFADVQLVMNKDVDVRGPVLAYREDTGALLFDVDGLGSKRPVLIATLLDVDQLSMNDFVIV